MPTCPLRLFDKLLCVAPNLGPWPHDQEAALVSECSFCFCDTSRFGAQALRQSKTWQVSFCEVLFALLCVLSVPACPAWSRLHLAVGSSPYFDLRANPAARGSFTCRLKFTRAVAGTADRPATPNRPAAVFPRQPSAQSSASVGLALPFTTTPLAGLHRGQPQVCCPAGLEVDHDHIVSNMLRAH